MNRTLNKKSTAALFTVLAAGLSACPAYPDQHDHWVEIKAPHFTVISNAGEHDGRRIAAQFEDVRGMFEQSFPKLRVDFGKPTVVFALTNEDSLKLLLPSYGQNKNAMKIAGLYKTAYDVNYAVIRTDVTGTSANEFHNLYHEYAHGLFRLNYRGLPLWLDEGLAEYWGNSQIENKEARVGLVDLRQIRILQQNWMLPVSTLLTLFLLCVSPTPIRSLPRRPSGLHPYSPPQRPDCTGFSAACRLLSHAAYSSLPLSPFGGRSGLRCFRSYYALC
jgi:hypothetical protein